MWELIGALTFFIVLFIILVSKAVYQLINRGR
jgi:hypothetical protein